MPVELLPENTAAAILDSLRDIEERVVRIETRHCRLMTHFGLDPTWEPPQPKSRYFDNQPETRTT